MNVDRSFPHNYEASVLTSIPTDGTALYCFPGAIADGVVDGPIVQIVRGHENEQPWVGTFADGDLSPNALTGIFTHPNPEWVCVVARGEAYIVNVSDPSQHESVNVVPVMGIVPVPSAGILVLYDFTRLVAFGAKGVKWRTPRLSWDGLRDVSFNGEKIVGTAWDSPGNRWVSFAIDPLNGSFVGGASPELLQFRKKCSW